MALHSSFPICTFMILTLMPSHLYLSFSSPIEHHKSSKNDIDLLQFAQNLEFLQAEWFLWGALGHGLDVVDPKLARGGPPPIGVQKANLDKLTLNIATEFGYQGVGHLRVLEDTVGLIPRPEIDLSHELFAKVINAAFGYQLNPPFNPYRNSLSFFLASYAVPYIGLTGYVGINPYLKGFRTKRVLGGLLGVEAGQDAVIRLYLYQQANEVVQPYGHTVAEFTTRISNLKNVLAKGGNKDEGISVPQILGAENQTSSNVLSANYHSLSYRRTPSEILRIVYGTGNETSPGGFLPKGAYGRIAQELLKKPGKKN